MLNAYRLYPKYGLIWQEICFIEIGDHCYNDSAGNMSLLSPAMWRKFIAPNLTYFCKEVHSYCPEAKIYCHICGNILPILEDLIETGLDCIAPLDPLGGFFGRRNTSKNR